MVIDHPTSQKCGFEKNSRKIRGAPWASGKLAFVWVCLPTAHIPITVSMGTTRQFRIFHKLCKIMWSYVIPGLWTFLNEWNFVRCSRIRCLGLAPDRIRGHENQEWWVSRAWSETTGFLRIWWPRALIAEDGDPDLSWWWFHSSERGRFQ